MLFDFGQPVDGLIQVSFSVQDLDKSMAEFTSCLNVGAWTVVRNLTSPFARYRGQPCAAAMHLAMAFGGHMQYELIQPADDRPSIQREVIETRGYGFHHFGYATTDFDRRVSAMHAQGYETVFSDTSPAGIRIAYFDTRDVLPGLTELIETSEAVDRSFTAMYLAGATPGRGSQPTVTSQPGGRQHPATATSP